MKKVDRKINKKKENIIFIDIKKNKKFENTRKSKKSNRNIFFDKIIINIILSIIFYKIISFQRLYNYCLNCESG